MSAQVDPGAHRVRPVQGRGRGRSCMDVYRGKTFVRANACAWKTTQCIAGLVTMRVGWDRMVREFVWKGSVNTHVMECWERIRGDVKISLVRMRHFQRNAWVVVRPMRRRGIVLVRVLRRS